MKLAAQDRIALDADVAVVGGGPAGAATATHLARAGVDVLLLDAQRFPRFKPCGEFMSPQCLPLLRELRAFDVVRDLGAQEVAGMELFGWGRSARGRFVDVGRARAPIAHGWAIRREVFDAALLDNARSAGVRVLEGVRVRSVRRDSTGRVLGVDARAADGSTLQVGARWTIGADGLRSRVARDLGVQRDDPRLRRMALVTRFAGASLQRLAQVHFFADGYFALAPVDGGLVSVNLVLSMDAFEREALPRDRAFEAWVERVPEVRERLAGAERVDPVRGVGPMSMRTTQQTFDGAALVGDACGYADPMTGEGVFFALKGASMLAASLRDALASDTVERAQLAPYLRGRAKEITPRARVCRWMVQALHRPTLARAAFRWLEARPGLADLAVSMSGDYATNHELLRPSVWTRAFATGARA